MATKIDEIQYDRHVETYHGYSLVVALNKGKPQGRAYYGTTNLKKNDKTLDVSGKTIADALENLKTVVNQQNDIDKRDIYSLHKEYLESIGRHDRGYSDKRYPRNPPEWKCFNCETLHPDFMGLLCYACHSEGCPHCGACRCGWLGKF